MARSENLTPSPTTRVVVLTGNSCPAHRYLIDRIKAAYPDSLVVGRRHTKRRYPWIISTARSAMRTVPTVIKKLLLKYDYPLRPLLLRGTPPDEVEPDINSNRVYDLVRAYEPDVICLFGTEKVDGRITSLAPTALNIHLGYVPHYRGERSTDWVAYHSNFRYFFNCIHEVVGELGTGNIFCMDPVFPHYFENIREFSYRQGTRAVDAMMGEIAGTCAGVSTPVQQPASELPPLTNKEQPDDFLRRASSNFQSANARLFKRSLPRTGRLEARLVRRFGGKIPTVLETGWYVLTYHAIVWDANQVPPGVSRIYTSQLRFEEQLDWLSQHLEVVSLSDGLSLHLSGESVDRRLVSITFDDSLNSASGSISPLREHGAVPTVFLSSSPLTRAAPLKVHEPFLKWQHVQSGVKGLYEEWAPKQYFTLDRIRSYLEAGEIEVGSHTRTHAVLSGSDVNEIRDEIEGAHSELEDALGEKIEFFAFPFGTQKTRNFIAEFSAMDTADHIFTCEGGINRNPTRGALLRIGVHNETPEELEKLLLRQYVR